MNADAPAKPAPAKPADSLDDLFPAEPAKPATPAVESEALPAPATEKPAEKAKPATDDPFADPFKISAEGRLPDRLWVDNTGTFHIEGRLIAVRNGYIRVLKGTGRTTTVPLRRLSETDRQYVEEVVELYGNALGNQFASR